MIEFLRRYGLRIQIALASWALAIAALLWFAFVPDDGEELWILLVISVPVGVVLNELLLRFSGQDIASKKLAHATLTDPAAQALLERWLRRSRYYRFVGGTLGFLVGTSAGHPIGGAFAGVAVGGALAEVHVLRRPTGPSGMADISVRSLRDYTNTADLVAMAVIAAGSVAVIAARALGYGSEYSAPWALGAVAILVAVLGLQHLVAVRSRPALRAELRQADDLLRLLASTQGFTRPAIALSFFTLASALGDGSQSQFVAVAGTVLFVLGLAWWYRGRRGRIPALAERALAP